MLYISLQYRYKNIRDLDIFVYESLRSCDKPLRNIDYLTVDVPFSRTETLKNSFFTRVCRAWNKLSLSIRESNTLPLFRKKLFINFYNKFSAIFLIVIILFLLWV